MRRPDLSLSKQLRSATREARRDVDRHRLVRAYSRGVIAPETYAEGLARLYPVYATMESALASAPRDDRLRAFALPAVSRAAAILADLKHFGVAPEPIRPGLSARYFARIRQIADDTPVLLLAHAYAHYFADVSGAMLVGRVARLGVSLAGRGGTAFVSFPGVVRRDDFRRDFQRRLDALPRNEVETLAVLREANVAFELHRDLAAELWAPPSEVVLRTERSRSSNREDASFAVSA